VVRLFSEIRSVGTAFLAAFLPLGAFFLSAAPAEARAGNDHQAVFVAYNIRNYSIYPSEIARGPVKSEAEREAVAEVIASLKPSILGLVEAGCDDSIKDLRDRLSDRDVVLAHKVVVEGPDVRRRLALLSEFPILENNSLAHVPFELAGKPQQMQRGLLDVTVALPEGLPLRFVGVHLKSKREVPNFDQEALRAREAREVRRHLDQVQSENPGLAVLVWGDFNFWKNDPSLRMVLGSAGSPQSLQIVELADQHGLKWTHYWEAADLYSRIDFILASPSAAALIAPGSPFVAEHPLRDLASDHRPLVLTLAWH
jgi:endonuclease/exonuclease/phosphatase family metal-dependent hydrolase